MKTVVVYLCLGLFTAGCGSEESRLVKKANSGHELRAHWQMKMHEQAGPSDLDVTVWEQGESFRIESQTQEQSLQDGGRWRPVVADDVLYTGAETIYFLPKTSSRPARQYQFKDKQQLAHLRFWRIDDINYTKSGQESIGGQNCLKLTASGQGIGGLTVDLTRWISTGPGYLMKSTTTNGGELLGYELICDKVELHPTYPAQCFVAPADCKTIERMSKPLW